MLAAARCQVSWLGGNYNYVGRLFAAVAGDVCPKQIRLLKEAKALLVEYKSGDVLTIPAELLRVFSPAANSRKSDQKILGGRKHVGIMKVEAVGNYAVRVQFDDLHGSGLFTWEALHDLGMRQKEHMQKYMQLLEEQGLSREPRRRK